MNAFEQAQLELELEVAHYNQARVNGDFFGTLGQWLFGYHYR